MRLALTRWLLYAQSTFATLGAGMLAILAIGTQHDIQTDGYSLLEGASVGVLTGQAIGFAAAALVLMCVGHQVGRGQHWERVALVLEVSVAAGLCVVARRMSWSDLGLVVLWSTCVLVTLMAGAMLLPTTFRRDFDRRCGPA